MKRVLNQGLVAHRSATSLWALVSALLWLWTASTAQAEDAASASATVEIGAIENDITASTSKQSGIVRELTGALKAKEDASNRLVALARVVVEQEQGLDKINQRIAALQADNAAALLDLAQRREALATLLAGLQNMSQNPPPALIVAPDDVTGALRGAMLFAAVIPELRREADHVKQALASVDAIRRELEVKRKQAEIAIQTLSVTRASIAEAIASRQAAAIASAKALTEERAKSKALAERARSLRELIAGIAQKREADIAALEQTLRNAPDFTDLQGKLEPPVTGAIIARFGDLSAEGPKLQGQRFATQELSQVLSPIPGRIEFAGEYLNYGQLVIVNPGRGYLVLLAGMHNISVEIGQSIRAREPLGDMGPTKLSVTTDKVNNSSLTNHSTPVLYVEFRKRNEPVDPSPWWKEAAPDRQARVGRQ